MKGTKVQDQNLNGKLEANIHTQKNEMPSTHFTYAFYSGKVQF